MPAYALASSLRPLSASKSNVRAIDREYSALCVVFIGSFDLILRGFTRILPVITGFKALFAPTGLYLKLVTSCYNLYRSNCVVISLERAVRADGCI